MYQIICHLHHMFKILKSYRRAHTPSTQWFIPQIDAITNVWPGKLWTQELQVSHTGNGAHTLGASSAAFPHLTAGNWIPECLTHWRQDACLHEMWGSKQEMHVWRYSITTQSRWRKWRLGFYCQYMLLISQCENILCPVSPVTKAMSFLVLSYARKPKILLIPVQNTL